MSVINLLLNKFKFQKRDYENQKEGHLNNLIKKDQRSTKNNRLITYKVYRYQTV